jgi:eukaryotic-like serine/threonine-protein kinase
MDEDLTALSRQLGDRYRIERLIGRGGMGAVYLARETRLDRPVALKVLPSEFAAQPDLRERFLRETRLAAGFSHPNIVPVFAIEESEQVLAFSMGFVEGESLTSRVERDGPLSQRDAVRLLQDVAYALAYAHGRDVVHRDIKPDNIMIERATGRALVMDFGIARAIAPVASKPGLTRVGEVVGTPEYMSPEQAAGEAVDGRSDLYSLGLVAWFAMVGRNAVFGDSTQRILVKQLTEPIPPLASVRSDLPSALCDAIDRCCMKEADDRFLTAESLVEALDATQLATPDVPVAVRLLAPELSSVGLRTFVALVLLSYGAYRIAIFGNGNFISIGVIFAASAWVAGVGAFQEIRRLLRAGYTVPELQRLFGTIQAERDEVRARRAADPTLVARRRKRIIAASVILAWQATSLFFMVRGALTDGDAKLQGALNATKFFGGLLACALAAAILLSSPFKRSLGETLFAGTWGGAFGRGFMRLIGGRLATGGTARSVAAAAVTAPLLPVSLSTAARNTAPAVTAAPVAHGNGNHVPAAPVSAAVRLTAVTIDSLATDVAALQQRMNAIEAVQQRAGQP